LIEERSPKVGALGEADSEAGMQDV